MSIADKLTQIAENEQRVYDAGYAKGKVEGGGGSSNDAFWETYQNGGDREDYATAFGGVGWTEDTFKPRYDIIPINAYMIFRGNPLMVDLVEYLNGLERTLDLSQAKNTQYMFSASKFTRIGVIDVRGSENSTPLDNCFSNCPNLVTIDKLILKTGSKGEFNSTFYNCSKLENLAIEGVITYDNLNLQWSPNLSSESIENVIRCLSSEKDAEGNYMVQGKTLTLSRAAVENAFPMEKPYTDINAFIDDISPIDEGYTANYSIEGNKVVFNVSGGSQTSYGIFILTTTFAPGTYVFEISDNRRFNSGMFYDSSGNSLAIDFKPGEPFAITQDGVYGNFYAELQGPISGTETIIMTVKKLIAWDELAATKPNWTISLA